MTKLEALKELLAKVEASGPAIDIMDLAAIAFPPEHAYGACTFHNVLPAFNGSLDAAKALHDAVLPGWLVRLSYIGDGYNADAAIGEEIIDGLDGAVSVAAECSCPARAWLIVILKALIAKEQEA